MESGDSHRPSGPILVGGTGRSGTHVVAALAGSGGRYAQVPAELRVHAARDGIPAYADGAIGRRRLLTELSTRWWSQRPAWDPSTARGIHRIAPRRRYLAALTRLAAAPPGSDRLLNARRFLRRLLDPLAPEPGAWVEKSPDNCAAAGFLIRLFPDLRLVHVIRDGRDAACSLMRVPWAPDDFPSALALWERRLLEAHIGTLEVPPGRVHRVMLEDLVWRDRERAYADLLAFLDLPDAPPTRELFETDVTPAHAGLGRWRLDLDASQRPDAEAMYRESLARLEAAGVEPLPGAEPGHDPGTVGRGAPSRLDPWAAATA
jgi:Sulfotransferase family